MLIVVLTTYLSLSSSLGRLLKMGEVRGMPFLTVLSESPQSFLQPTSDVSSQAIAYLKVLLDPLASEVADAQKARKDSARRKRKRSDDEVAEQVLQLRTVYTNGLGVKQVWEQARRVLDATCAEVERSVLPASQGPKLQLNGMDDEHHSNADQYEAKTRDPEQVQDDDIASVRGEEDLISGEDVHAEDEDELIQDDPDFEDIEEDEDEGNLSDEIAEKPDTYLPDPNGLNDGFFSIDEFNRQSQFLEQMDARGDDDNPSDEDDVDWDTNPLAISSAALQAGEGNDGEIADQDDGGDEGGPTFANADLDASGSDGELDGEDGYLDEGLPGLSNTNDIRYRDFFAPPLKRPSKTKRMRALPKTQPPKATHNLELDGEADDDVDADLQRAMNDVRRDILASGSELSDSDDASDTDPARLKNLSTHEKQRAKIAAEIRRLEAANVSKREWTLSGEARAADRPLNSLIEEDLEFERVGKPVPVITAEVSEEIEQLIRRRILAREFDEVVRRHPDAVGDAFEVRRGRAEVDDTRPQTGLAELYEQEHLRSTDPGYVDKRSVATKKQHQEIDKLWKEVSYQLDLLSNLHFKPKRLDMEVRIIEDKPKISMEDARPSGEGIGVEESQLAPQEVYRAGSARREGEVVRKSGASLSKDEMSREEKLRRRRREKERIKKGKANVVEVKKPGISGKKGRKDEKQGILEELRKGNVRVIDKKGEKRNLGKEKDGGRGVSSSTLKL